VLSVDGRVKPGHDVRDGTGRQRAVRSRLLGHAAQHGEKRRRILVLAPSTVRQRSMALAAPLA